MKAKPCSPFINVINIEKEYPVPHINPFKPQQKMKALKGVDLQIPQGSVTCVLGPNGAGKTTLIKILAGLILPDTGEIQQPQKINIGLVTPNDRSFYWRLTGRQNLGFFAALYNIKYKAERIDQVLKEVDLKDGADKPFRLYSAGMKQKLNIARALLSDPLLYLLDEPATHLDPLAKEDFWTFVDEVLLKKRNATVLLCTHDMEEAERLADSIAILHEGKIIAQGDPVFLRKTVRQASFYQLLFHEIAHEWRDKHRHLISVEKDKELEMNIEAHQLNPLIESFIKMGGSIREIRKKEPLLVDVMKHFIGAAND